MATQIQFRKGTTLQHSTFTGANAELTVDTDKKTVVVHDGVTVGGIPLAKSVDVGVPYTTTTGSAILPKGTTAQRDVTPLSGYFRFNTEYSQAELYNGSAWGAVGGATGGPGNPAFYENDITISQNYTITTNKNAMSAGPVTIADSIVVTVPIGSVWSIV